MFRGGDKCTVEATVHSPLKSRYKNRIAIQRCTYNNIFHFNQTQHDHDHFFIMITLAT